MLVHQHSTVAISKWYQLESLETVLIHPYHRSDEGWKSYKIDTAVGGQKARPFHLKMLCQVN